MKHVMGKAWFSEVVTQAVDVVSFLSKSSSKYLVRAQSAMKRIYGMTLQLMKVCETRWNSLQMLLASLLRVRSALKSFAIEEGDDLPTELHPFLDAIFWHGIEIAEAVVRPLALMSFALEKHNTTLAHVFHALGSIYQHLQQSCILNHDSTLSCDISKRWNAQEQPLYVLAYLLHPQFMDTAMNMLVRMENSAEFSHVFSKRVWARVSSAYFEKWFPNHEQLSASELPIEFSMYNYLTNESFRMSTFPKGATNSASQWSYHTAWDFAVGDPRYRQLAIFSLKLLGTEPQSASQERVFKEYARQKSASRNKMSTTTMTMLATVRLNHDSKIQNGYNVAVESSRNRIVSSQERPRLARGHASIDSARDVLNWDTEALEVDVYSQSNVVICGDNVEAEAEGEGDVEECGDGEWEEEVVEQGEITENDNHLEFWKNALESIVDDEGGTGDSSESDDDVDENDTCDNASVPVMAISVEVQLPSMHRQVFNNLSDFSIRLCPEKKALLNEPLPMVANSRYPQENLAKLKNFRAAKFPLLSLFGYPGNDAGVHPGCLELFALVKCDTEE